MTPFRHIDVREICMRSFLNRVAAAAFSALLIVGSASAAEGPNSMDAATETKLKSLLSGPQRGAENKARDAFRHPLETLKFMGLKQDMTVMEIWPGGGWWSEFLAPLLADKGKYIAAQPNAKAVASLQEKAAKDSANFGKMQVVTFPENGAPTGSVDLILTFRNMHNWMGRGQEKQMFDAMYAALKPGGYLGIKEHRASTNAPQDPKAGSGYVREDFAIKTVESSGFKLVSKSEVNANPKDTKDYPQGVWTLPPNYAEGDKDKAKYTAIGESDRFTMLFQKPK
jgi:predicted methyltransferase